MDETMETVVKRAVAAALQAHGIGDSPAAVSSAAAAAASPPKILVTSRDLPEGVAVHFVSNHGVRIFIHSFHMILFPWIVVHV